MRLYRHLWRKRSPLLGLMHLERARDGERTYTLIAGGKRWALMLVRERRP